MKHTTLSSAIMTMDCATQEDMRTFFSHGDFSAGFSAFFQAAQRPTNAWKVEVVQEGDEEEPRPCLMKSSGS